MFIKILAIGDSNNNFSTLKKYTKNSRIKIIDFPRKGATRHTCLKKDIEFFDSLRISKQVKKINRIKNEFDLCIVMSWAAARIAYLAGLNYVIYFIGNDIKTPPFVKNSTEPYLTQPLSNFNFIERWFYKIVLKNAVACVTGTEPLFNQLKKYRKDAVRIDRWIVDATIFNDKVEPITKIKNKFTFFSPQRNGLEKGMDIVWNALSLCHSDFEILMVKWFDERNIEEKKIIKKLLEKTPPQIKFIPIIKKEDVPKYYKFSDAVLGQIRSGIPGGIEREAISCGRLVVSYFDPNITYFLDGRQLRTDFLSDIQDPIKLANIIDRIVESEEFRKIIFEKELKFFSEIIDPVKCAASWENLFENLIKKYKSINRNTSFIKNSIENFIALLVEKLIYNRVMREKNIQAWGKDEYERLTK